MSASCRGCPGHLDIAPEQVRPLLEGLIDAPADLAVRLTPQADLSARHGKSFVVGRPLEYGLAGLLRQRGPESGGSSC